VVLAASDSRPDVGRIFGKGDNHGFSGAFNAANGTHQVCVYAIDSWGGANSRVRCSTVDVNGFAFGALDAVTSTSPGQISVTGWALDPNTPDQPIYVHVYAPGKAAQQLLANTSRPDVGRIVGMGDNHGFTGTLAASKGTQTVCVYAIDSWNGTNPKIKCQSVTVH